MSMAAMDTSVVRFRQRNIPVRVELTLHPDYVEFSMAGIRSNTSGFNVGYALLPSEFNYRTFRAGDGFVLFPLLLVSGLTLLQLAMPRNPVYEVLGFMVVYGLICCAIGYALRRFLRRAYTALPTSGGNLLIVKDAQHDQILTELQARRAVALRKSAVINPALPPWMEIKRFKRLREEGIISDGEFKTYRERILGALEETAERAAQAVPSRMVH
jgi:hypothetical protein